MKLVRFLTLLSLVGVLGLTAVPGSASSRASQATAAESPTAHASARKRLPNVVGMNHQRAQDLLQSRGFYRLRERDCSGRGRVLLWDRNWKVVRQSPRAGKRVSTSRAITLCSVKYTD
jgi:beta-lactam-binding protein with PASTA domain